MAGTVNRTSTWSPLRRTLVSGGGPGTFENGGSGGPFLPQLIPAVTATIATISAGHA